MQTSQDFNKQILVVEDEGLIAVDIQRRLERLGYPLPALASSGAEALQCARSTPVDLVLMDIHLKGDVDGIATAQQLKTELGMPIVYLTAHSDAETIDRAKLTEPLGYILKPITDGDLRSVVQISLHRFEMEKRVRAVEAWLYTTLRCVGEGILATDPNGDIFFLNPVAEQLTGWPASAAHGRPLMEVMNLLDDSTGQPAANPVLDLFRRETASYTLVSRVGAKTPVELACSENRTEHEVFGAVLVLRDIQARKDMEARMIQAQRMEAIANLAGGLAHDFNNQLTVISGYADELGTRLIGENRRQAGEIRQAAAIAAATTTKLLALSRRNGAQREVFDFHDLVSNVRPLIASTVGGNRTLEIAMGSTHGYVRGDRHQLQQVLLNLAIRARDVMPPAGELRLEGDVVDVAGDSALARMYRPGSYVRLKVIDNVEGMSQATAARIFEPLFAVGKPGFGSGLGLSIVHNIIVASGGYIHAESEPGIGTTFEIWLPCVGIFLPQTGYAAEATTVLLVEDEDGVRRLMQLYLGREGYQLLQAHSAEDAAAIAAVFPQPIHALVTDVVMPGLTGPELAERLVPSHPGMKVLFVSGYRHHTLEHEGLWKNGLNLLPKPFPAAELVRRVRLLVNPAEAVRQ